jgi:pentatricopeptide repeat protein
MVPERSSCSSGFIPPSRIINLAWLSLFLLPPTGAFSPPIHQHLNLQNSFSSSATRSSILQTPIDDDAVVETNHTTSTTSSIGDNEDMLIPKPKFSKAKWKKKRYLMMQDVQKKIQKNDPNAPRKAEEMVRRMLKLYENSGNDMDFRPTQQAYNLWIHALAKSKLENAGKLADQVMEQMRAEHVEPNAFTYTSVMDAYARSQSPEKAEDVLFRLLEEGPANGVSVSEVTCDTMLNAWAQQGTAESAERAQLILYRLEEWQREDLRPSKISYTTGTSQCSLAFRLLR